MEDHDRLFSSMKAGEVLEYVRDKLAHGAAMKRSYYEQSAAISGQLLSKGELAEVAALIAAAEMIQLAVSVGQEAKAKGQTAPEWVMRMASQARVSLTAPVEN